MKHFNTRIKQLILALSAAGLIGLSGAALAAPGGDRMDRMDRLADKLELDIAQTEHLQALFSAHREAMQQIEWRTEDGQRNPEAREQAREAKMALREEINAVLTPEQAEKFEAMAQRRGGKHPRGRHMGQALQGLDLSKEQKQAMRELMQEHRDQGRAGQRAIRAGMREILTEEQLAELRAQAPRDGQRRGFRGRRNG